MEKNKNEIASLLETLSPKGESQQALLRWIFECAEQMVQGLGLHRTLAPTTWSSVEGFSVVHLLEAIPEASKRYLHGLIEAIEIYRTIQGPELCVSSLATDDKKIHELRQIRDLCLEASLRSIY